MYMLRLIIKQKKKEKKGHGKGNIMDNWLALLGKSFQQ